MGERSNAASAYLSVKAHFADFINGSVYHGEQVVQAEELEICDKDYYPVDDELKKKGVKRTPRHRDVVMRDGKGTKYAVIGIEAQDEIHYALPVRCMEYDAAEYRRQLDEIGRDFVKGLDADKEKKNKVSNAEFLSRMHSWQKLQPVVTVAFYHGKKKYNGCKDLHSMLNWNEKTNKYLPYVANYKVNLVTPEDLDENYFKTGLRELIGILKRREDKESMAAFMEDNKSRFQNLDDETYEVIGILSGYKNLLKRKEKNRNEEGGIDMCRAFEEMVQDGVRKGEKIGEERGEKRGEKRGVIKGERRVLKLIEHMSAHGDGELIPQLSKDPELMKKMYQKYHVV